MMPILLIIGFNLALYIRTICFGYVMDDVALAETIKKYGSSNAYFGKCNSIKKLASRLYGCATFSLNTKLDHAFTIFLWIVLNILIYYSFGHNFKALVATLLVSCHPLMNQLSIWLNGRRYLICAILLMGMMCLPFPFGISLYLLSSFFQVTILMAPVLYIFKYPWVIFGCVVLLILMKDLLIHRIKERLKNISSNDLKKWQPRRPIVIVKIFGFYFRRMIFPGRVQMVYPFLQLYGRTKEGCEDAYRINADFMVGIICLLVYICILAVLPMNLKPWGLFMGLSLLQWCAIMPITQLVADRFAAVPTIFMCFFIVHFLNSITYGWAIIFVLMGNYIYSTIEAFKMYKNINEWYDYHVYPRFNNLVVLNLRIAILLQEKKLWQAQTYIENGLKNYPNDYALNFCGYIASMIVGAIPLAQQYISKCKNNVYLGEDRKQEIADAEIGLQAMSQMINQQRGKR